MISYCVEITEEALLDMNRMPERYPVINIEIEFVKDLRLMPVDNYSVFYCIRENRVIVTNVLYSASDIQTRLQKN